METLKLNINADDTKLLNEIAKTRGITFNEACNEAFDNHLNQHGEAIKAKESEVSYPRLKHLGFSA